MAAVTDDRRLRAILTIYPPPAMSWRIRGVAQQPDNKVPGHRGLTAVCGTAPMTAFADHDPGVRGAVGHHAAAREHRIEHHRGSFPGGPGRPGVAPPPAALPAWSAPIPAAAPTGFWPAGQAGTAATRSGSSSPRTSPTQSSSFPQRRGLPPTTGTARSGRERGWPRPRSPACWTCRHAGDRPHGTPAPRRAAAVHRPRWPPVHLCQQHLRRPAR